MLNRLFRTLPKEGHREVHYGEGAAPDIGPPF
jgi:hypothetical protein